MVARSIKVVQMLPELESGGVERGTLELGRYLSERDHESIVISAGGRLAAQLAAEGSRHICWTVGQKNPFTLKYMVPLRRLLVNEKVDILHLRSRVPAWLGYLVWQSLPVDRRPRLVTTFHGFYSVNAFSAVMTKGERVIAISNTIAAHIQEAYNVPAQKLTVIYRGFDQAAFDPQAVSADRIEALRTAWQVEHLPTPLIMLPGRLSRWKGHDIFIQALAQIRDLNWTAVCVGDTTENQNYSQSLQALSGDLGLTERLLFVGHCSDMPAALLLADVVVSAASTEPEAFGRVAVEAQAMGKPVVATAHGGSLETVRDRSTGWLVEPVDADSMAGALKEAVMNPVQRKTYGTAGRQWVRDHFTMTAMCAETVGVYQRLLDQR